MPGDRQIRYAGAVRAPAMAAKNRRKCHGPATTQSRRHGRSSAARETLAGPRATPDTAERYLRDGPFTQERWEKFLRLCEENGLTEQGLVVQGFVISSNLDIFTGRQAAPESGVLTALQAEFCHTSGDMATLVDIYYEWEGRLKGEGREATSEWSTKNFLNEPTLYRIKNWKDDHVVLKAEVTKAKQRFGQRVSDLLVEASMGDLCLYRGHDTLGYYNLKSEENLQICPQSTTHSLLQKPRLALLIPRPGHVHAHAHKQKMFCHYVVALDERRAEVMLRECDVRLTDIFQSNITVERIEGLASLGTQGMSRLEGGILEGLQALSHGTPVVVDRRVTGRSGAIVVFANSQHHDAMREQLNKRISATRQSERDDTAEFGYPHMCSDFRLVIGAGGEVVETLFPGQPSRPNAAKDITLHADDNVSFRNDVTIEISMGDLRSLSPCQQQINPGHSVSMAPREFDAVAKTRAVVKRLLWDVNERLWRIEGCERDESSPATTLVILRFLDHVSSTRALALIEEGRQAGIPIAVLNEANIRVQMTSFQIHVSARVYPMLEQALHIKLDNMRRSPKHRVEYKVMEDGGGGCLVQVCAASVGAAAELQQRFRDLLEPSKVTVKKYMARHLATSPGLAFLDRVADDTSTYVLLPPFSGSLLVYGARKAKLECQSQLRAYCDVSSGSLHGSCWHSLGRMHKDLPADVMSRIMKTVAETNSSPDLELMFFPQKGEVFSKGLSEDRAKKQIVLNEHARSWMKKCGDLGDSLWEEDASECSACLSPIGDTTFTLGGCGHTFCLDCLSTQLRTAVRNTQWPLHCAHCDLPFTLSDVTDICGRLRIFHLDRLLQTALRRFVMSHSTQFRHCQKRLCEGIFRLGDSSGDASLCSVCSRKVCPLCFERFHRGMNCEEYRDSFLSIDHWMSENQATRKQCSNCNVGIEKVEGCNNVRCVFCQKNLCWVCLAIFSTARECYNHMNSSGHWANPA